MTTQLTLDGARDGRTFDEVLDKHRLNAQMRRVAVAMLRDGRWQSLHELQLATGDPQASISARLRDLRKPRFGSHTVERRRRLHVPGTWEYRLILRENYPVKAHDA